MIRTIVFPSDHCLIEGCHRNTAYRFYKKNNWVKKNYPSLTEYCRVTNRLKEDILPFLKLKH